MYLAIGRRITYTPSVEAQLVEKRAKRCLSVWSYFADVMLTYKRYQALHAIHIRVPGEPGNEATISRVHLSCSKINDRGSWFGNETTCAHAYNI